MDQVRIPIAEPYAVDVRRNYHGRQATVTIDKRNFLKLSFKPERHVVDTIGEVQGQLFTDGNVKISTRKHTTHLGAFDSVDGKVRIWLGDRYYWAECMKSQVLYEYEGQIQQRIIRINVTQFEQGDATTYKVDGQEIVEALLRAPEKHFAKQSG